MGIPKGALPTIRALNVREYARQHPEEGGKLDAVRALDKEWLAAYDLVFSATAKIQAVREAELVPAENKADAIFAEIVKATSTGFAEFDEETS